MGENFSNVRVSGSGLRGWSSGLSVRDWAWMLRHIAYPA